MGAQPIGFSAPLRFGPVSMPSASFRSDRPLVRIDPGSFSRAEVPPQSSFVSSPATRLSSRCMPTRVSALFAASPERVHILRELPTSRFVPSSGFRSLSTVYSASWLDGFVSTRSHVQGSCPFRGFSPRTAVPPSLKGVPPCRCPPPARAPKGTLPRRACSASRPCSMRGRVHSGLVLPAPDVAPLFGFASPRCAVSNPRLRFPAAFRS